MSVCQRCRHAGQLLTQRLQAKYTSALDEAIAADHAACPEQARQADPSLTATEKAGSSLCDCQHGTVSIHVANR